MKIPKLIFDFIFPNVCFSCRNKIINAEKNIALSYCCDGCLSSFPLAPPPDKIINQLITFFENDEIAISNAAALFAADNEFIFINLVYQLKYHGFTKIGKEFGILLGKLLRDYGLNDYDFILPVPIHPARRRERGYNQAESIAEGVGEILGIKVKNNLIKRTKYTTSQTRFSAVERSNNIKDVFKINPECSVVNSSILLIDDVLTTGSTLNSCATVLLENKARKVDAAALLKA